MSVAGLSKPFGLAGLLMPGSEDKAVGLVDAYLASADTAAQLAALGG